MIGKSVPKIMMICLLFPCFALADEGMPLILSMYNECNMEEKISDVTITVSQNGIGYTDHSINGDYTIWLIPNIVYTVAFQADGYASRTQGISVGEYPEFQRNIYLTPLVNNVPCDHGTNATVTGSILNGCTGENIVSGVAITVSENNSSYKIEDFGGDYIVSLIPNTSYTIAFDAGGYETRRYENISCKEYEYSGVNIYMSPIVSLSDIISVLKILTDINTEPPAFLENRKIEMSHTICMLQTISGLR